MGNRGSFTPAVAEGSRVIVIGGRRNAAWPLDEAIAIASAFARTHS